MAIPMPIGQDIRRLDRQGMSRVQIAKRLGVDRAMVAKYADMGDLSPARPAARAGVRKTDAYEPVIGAWLEANLRMPRKQRHTAKRVYDRLVAKHGFDGSCSGVQRYVKQWREEHRERPDGFLDLVWHPGEMQIDFGVAAVSLAGRVAQAHVLVVSLPDSNLRLCVPMPGENAEYLCEGLMTVFERIGGVPPMVGNATGTSHCRSDGSVTLTDVFAAFVAHYRIEVRFCNPYLGHEKGSVENAVGFLRRNLMGPPPACESWRQLGRVMLARSAACPNRSGMSVSDVFEEERGSLLAMPSVRFDAVRWESRRTDKYGRRARRPPLPRRRGLEQTEHHGGGAMGHGNAHGPFDRSDGRRIRARVRRRRVGRGRSDTRHAHARQTAARLVEQSDTRPDPRRRALMARLHGRARPQNQPRRHRRILPERGIRPVHARMP